MVSLMVKKYFVDVNAAKDQIVKGFYGKRKSNGIHLVKSMIIDYANRKNNMSQNLEDQRACSPYQYYTYTEQLEIKMNLVKELIDNTCKYDYEFLTPVESVEHFGYRNKMEFSFGNETKDGPTILGLHKKNSFHDIVEVNDLKLMDNNFNKIYIYSNEFFKRKNVDFYHKTTKKGYLRHLVIRKGHKQILVNLITTSQMKIDDILSEYLNGLLEIKLEDDYEITGVLHTINDNLSDTVQSDKEYILYGKEIFLNV